MTRRKLKKRAKRWMDHFSQTKIPAAFESEAERRQFVSAWARKYVGQRHPEKKGELPNDS